MSNNAYMFIATEPLGPVWSQTGSDGKLQNQNDAWQSWASNYVWIPSYIAYGLVDMVPWQDTVAMADITLKPCQSQMDPSKGRGIKGMESSSKRHEGKSSLAPDELLGPERADETSASLFSHRLLETRAVSVRTRGKNFIKICCGSLRCILQRSQTPRLIHTRLCKNSTCSRTGLLAAVRGLQSGSGSLFKLLPVHRSQKSSRDRKSTHPNALATSVPCPALPVCSCPLLHAEFPTSGSGECANFFKHVDKQDEAHCVCV